MPLSRDAESRSFTHSLERETEVWTMTDANTYRRNWNSLELI